MEGGTKAVNISAGSCLRFAILLWRGIARRTKCHRISRLPWLEVTSNTEVDQVDLPIRSQHDVRGFEIAEDDRRLARMQIVKHCAELNAHIKHFFDEHTPRLCVVQVLVEGFTFDEIHHEVPVSKLEKLIIN